jgi:hypothetical protein
VAGEKAGMMVAMPLASRDPTAQTGDTDPPRSRAGKGHGAGAGGACLRSG